jgi:hypothetical protein
MDTIKVGEFRSYLKEYWLPIKDHIAWSKLTLLIIYIKLGIQYLRALPE